MNYSTNFGLKLPQRGVEMANINDLNDNTEDIDTIMHQNRTMLGEAYDPDKVAGYTEGDFVVQLGQFYECISDTSGVWDPTAWQLTDIGTVLKALAGGGSGGHTYSTVEQVVGKWIDGKNLYEKTIVIPNFSANTQDSGWYYGTVNLSDYSINPERLFPQQGETYIVLQDTTPRIPIYIDWQGGTSLYLYFLGSRSGTLTVVVRYTKSSS